MVLNIQTGKNNKILRQKAKPVDKITPKTKELILNMIQTMYAHDGIGLAAPQVGQSLQIIVIQIGHKETIALINPKIIRMSIKKSSLEEGCLSLPDVYFPIKRRNRIVVEATSTEGQKIKFKAKKMLARIIQHEIDHLNGILISDK